MADWLVFAVSALLVTLAVWVVADRMRSLSKRSRRIVKVVTLLCLLLWLLKLVEAFAKGVGA